MRKLKKKDCKKCQYSLWKKYCVHGFNSRTNCSFWEERREIGGFTIEEVMAREG